MSDFIDLPPRPKTNRLAGWLLIAGGGIYLLLTPIWLLWGVAWDGFASFFWPLEILAIAVVVVGIVLVVGASKAETHWRDEIQRIQWIAMQD